jgi:hypothetical protein
MSPSPKKSKKSKRDHEREDNESQTIKLHHLKQDPDVEVWIVRAPTSVSTSLQNGNNFVKDRLFPPLDEYLRLTRQNFRGARKRFTSAIRAFNHKEKEFSSCDRL